MPFPCSSSQLASGGPTRFRASGRACVPSSASITVLPSSAQLARNSASSAFAGVGAAVELGDDEAIA